MKKISKYYLFGVGIVGILALTIVSYKMIKRIKISEMVSHTRYVVLVDEESFKEQKKTVPLSLGQKIAERVKENTSVKVLGKKSVSYGKIFLLDEHLNPIARIGILEFPLFTFNGTQIELNFDIVRAYGFSIKGYEPQIK